MTLPPKPFYFIRHGETDWNRNRIYMGSTDIPLNARGKEQAYDAAKLLKGLGISYIFSSPLLRARETAEIIAQAIRIEGITFIDDFKECGWGIKEGQPKEGDGAKLLRAWMVGNPHEGAETRQIFESRIKRGLRHVLVQEENILIVAHSGVYRMVQSIVGQAVAEIKNCIPVYYAPPAGHGQGWRVHVLSREGIKYQ